MDRQKKQNRTDWLNTPNAYKREEVEETGTPNPKKITKVEPNGWIVDIVKLLIINCNSVSKKWD